MPSRSGDSSVGVASLTDLLVLADATPAIGAGHAMRCAALAEAWRDQQIGRVLFAGRVTIPFVQARLRGLGVEIVAPDAVRSVADPSVVVVDSYDPSRREHAVKMPATLRVAVDDLGDPIPPAFHVVWNPNAYGTANMYSQFRGRVVTGPDAVPLRGGLPVWNGPRERGIGVSLGGGVIPNALRAAVEELPTRFPDRTVYGVGAWGRGSLQEISGDDPWTQLVRCERVLLASGTTTWEAAAVGIPVALVRTASNQARLFEWARQAGAPGVSMDEAGDEEKLAEQLAQAVKSAAKLPRIKSGAASVARLFASLVEALS